MRVRVDVSAHSALALCRCGWRTLASNHLGALHALAQHERQCHPGDKHARAALAVYRKRHAA